MNVFTLGLKSAWHWAELTTAGRQRRNHSNIGKSYRIDEGGTYTIYRQTDSNDGWVGKPVVLVVGFRLKWLGNNNRAHRLFKPVSILTTPIWSGFRGFRTKLWMVDEKTKNYLGIYKWVDPADAEHYARYIQKVLQFFSEPGTVWHKIYPADFDLYLMQRSVDTKNTRLPQQN